MCYDNLHAKKIAREHQGPLPAIGSHQVKTNSDSADMFNLQNQNLALSFIRPDHWPEVDTAAHFVSKAPSVREPPELQRA